jgi:hypothetical protein
MAISSAFLSNALGMVPSVIANGGTRSWSVPVAAVDNAESLKIFQPY